MDNKLSPHEIVWSKFYFALHELAGNLRAMMAAENSTYASEPEQEPGLDDIV